jgi:hypothetical protein
MGRRGFILGWSSNAFQVWFRTFHHWRIAQPPLGRDKQLRKCRYLGQAAAPAFTAGEFVTDFLIELV